MFSLCEDETLVLVIHEIKNPQIGQVVAALFATELFHVHFCAKSSGIQGRVKFEISTHFSVPKWKK